MCTRWCSEVLRSTDFGLSLPEFDFSYLRTGWGNLQSLRWLEFSIDEVLWTFVMLLESVALAAMLCYFFVFCGCTL